MVSYHTYICTGVCVRMCVCKESSHVIVQSAGLHSVGQPLMLEDEERLMLSLEPEVHGQAIRQAILCVSVLR